MTKRDPETSARLRRGKGVQSDKAFQNKSKRRAIARLELCVLIFVFYGVYVIVIVFVLGSQSTLQPKFSVTNLKGSIVLEFMIMGLTS